MSDIDDGVYQPSPSSDAELLRAIAADDRAAFQILYRRYVDHLYGFALSYVRDPATATDVVQDVFIQVWRQRDKLYVQESLRVFLFKVTRNTALNSVRSTRRRERIEHDPHLVEHHIAASAESADRVLERVEDRQRVIRAVLALPARTREAIILRWAHGLSYQEIGQAMSVSGETVKSQLARGLLLLRERL